MLFTLLVILAIAGMEFVAWAAHKYLMHGPLWSWHADHHLPRNQKHGFFEKNDRFFLVFAVPSALCYILGSTVPSLHFLFPIGVGISIYGLIYFLIHDVYIHRRFSWFRQLENMYSKAILRAHARHHARREKEDCESFGLLVVHPRFFRNQARKKPETAANPANS